MIALLLMLQAVAAPAPGFYQSVTPEVGAAIELDSDGQFLYALDYGAISESAEGTWRANGASVTLTVTKAEGAWRGADLATTPLRIDGDSLLLDRYGVTVRFQRESDPGVPPNRNHKLDEKD